MITKWYTGLAWSTWCWMTCIHLAIGARLSGLRHKWRGHRVHWRDHVDLWFGMTGEIWCEACPDTTDGKSDLSIWSRQTPPLWAAAQLVCGWLGHGDRRHPHKVVGQDFEKDIEILTDQWYCYRCMADVDAPKE